MVNKTSCGRVTTIVPSLMSISIVLTGCVVQVHSVTAPNASSCRFTGITAGLKISAEPFTEEDRLRKFFGDDLLSKGILPVLIVFENQDAEDGFSIVQEQVRLEIEQSRSELEKKTRASVNVDATEPPLTYSTSPVRDFTVGLLFGPLGSIAVETHYRNLAIIARNMEEKKLTDRIVYPGSTHHGFIYFRIEGRDDAAQIRRMSFATKNIRTNAIRTIAAVAKSS